MSTTIREQGAIIPAQRAWMRTAATVVLVSAVVGAVGVAFLVAMFAAFAVGAQSAGEAFGWINDVLVLVMFLLAAPGVLAIHVLLRELSPRLTLAATAIAFAALAAIVVLQLVLVVGMLTFEQQIGPASVAFLVLGAWFIVTGYVGQRTGRLSFGVETGVLAAVYVGYPLWAYRLGRQLNEVTATPAVG